MERVHWEKVYREGGVGREPCRLNSDKGRLFTAGLWGFVFVLGGRGGFFLFFFLACFVPYFLKPH